MSIKPVIAVTLFNRPSYTRILFNALSKCYGVSDVPVVISQDWNNECEAQCVEVRDIANAFLTSHSGGGEYFCNNPKLGIDLNKLFVIPKAFERGDAVIFLEDDMGSLSQDTLNYFIAMGNKFKDDLSVASISGYNRLSASQWAQRRGEVYGVERCKGFVPWGFLVWRDRWDKMFADNAERYLRETGTQANGLFDHNWHEQGYDYIRPVIGRTNHVGGENATHTPSAEWLREHEFCPFGAWSLDVPNDSTAWD